MSGGDSTGRGGGIITPGEDCDGIKIKARLSSVYESVLDRLHVKDVLDISKKDASIVAMKDDEIVGSIASVEVVKLKVCIDSGHVYSGIVLEKDDGKCIIVITSNREA